MPIFLPCILAVIFNYNICSCYDKVFYVYLIVFKVRRYGILALPYVRKISAAYVCFLILTTGTKTFALYVI
jgi:hypothetical protein